MSIEQYSIRMVMSNCPIVQFSNCPIVQLSNCPIVHFDQVRFEMAIMDYETGMNHNPQVSEIVSDNDDDDDG